MQSAPKLAYVSTHFPRLAQTYIFDEVMALRSRGVSIVNFAMNAPTPADLTTPEAREASAATRYFKARPAGLLAGFLARLVRQPRATLAVLWLAIVCARMKPRLLLGRVAHFLYAVQLLEACENEGIDHVHAHDGKQPGNIAWFCHELDRRTAARARSWSFTVHSVREFADLPETRLDLKVASASRVVCICDFIRAQLYETCPVEHWDRLVDVRCGIVLCRYPRRAARPLANPPTFVTVGRLAREKGQLILVRAMRSLMDRGIAARLELIGEGSERERLATEVDRLGLKDSVVFAGQLHPLVVSERLAQADVFCLPSFQEGLPISIMEAMAVGVPVVSTGVSGIPELATHRETALLAPPGNVEALADALSLMLADASLRDTLIDAAGKRVARMHDVDVTSKAMLDMFEACVAERRDTRPDVTS